MTSHTKIHVFPSRSMKNCTCLHLLHANERLKTRGVEGLLPNFRAFLTNLHVHYIIFLQSRLYIEYMLYLCVLILHLKLCLFRIETMRLFRQTFSLSSILTTFAPCIGGIYESKSSIIQRAWFRKLTWLIDTLIWFYANLSEICVMLHRNKVIMGD